MLLATPQGVKMNQRGVPCEALPPTQPAGIPCRSSGRSRISRTVAASPPQCRSARTASSCPWLLPRGRRRVRVNLCEAKLRRGEGEASEASEARRFHHFLGFLSGYFLGKKPYTRRLTWLLGKPFQRSSGVHGCAAQQPQTVRSTAPGRRIGPLTDAAALWPCAQNTRTIATGCLRQTAPKKKNADDVNHYVNQRDDDEVVCSRRCRRHSEPRLLPLPGRGRKFERRCSQSRRSGVAAAAAAAAEAEAVREATPAHHLRAAAPRRLPRHLQDEQPQRGAP